MLSRRRFARSLALAAGYSLLPLGRRAFALTAPDAVQKRMIVIFLRGAVDGLSIVVPYREAEYYAKRSTIALPPPGHEGGALDLDGQFGLHPALSPLLPYWRDKSFAFVQACGFPSNVRSHFEAQDIIETASLGSHAQAGWMNALISLLPDTRSPTRALSFSGALPRIFSGQNSVASVGGGLKADSRQAFENPRVEHEFAALYGQNKVLNALYEEGKNSHNQLIDDLKKEMQAANNNAPHPDGFPGQAARLAAMIDQDPSIQLAFIDIGGWDTHVNQGNAKGQLAGHLEKLGLGLAALMQGLRAHGKDTAVMVISEFGRTVAENGNNGTDHGHGNAIWLLGGGVNGGRLHGRWPGLAPHQLFEGRDLAATTDFRSVIGSVLHAHFGLDHARIGSILADYHPDNGLKDVMRG